MDAFVDRLFEFMATKGLSQNKFEELCGLTHTNLREKKQGPTAAYMMKILSAFPSLSADWLLTGQGTMLKDGENSRQTGKRIPLVPMDAIAGPGATAYDKSEIEDFYMIREFKNTDFLLRVKGDSMAPKYNGGDIVACRRVIDTLFFQWGRIYVIRTNSQGTMIKRVQSCEEDGFITLVSENEKYAPFNVPVSDISSMALVYGAVTLE